MKGIFRKTAAWILVLCMLLSSAAIAEGEPKIGDTVKVLNAGFEEIDGSGLASSWSGSFWGTNASVDTSKAHTGSNSLKISTSQGGNPWVCQTISLYPGGVYELGVWLNTQLSDVGSRGAGFKIENYMDNGSGAGGDTVGETYTLSSNGMWVQHKVTFTVPENATKTKIYMRLYCNGTAWYDDVTVTFTGGPEKFKFYNDHVFMYPDEDKGTAEVDLNAFYSGKGVEKDYKVEFKLIDDETKEVVTKSDVAFIDEKAVFTYKPDIMSKMHKKYILRATVTGKGETYEFQDNMYKYERPTSMQKDGTFKFKDGNGEIFNPVMAYHVDSASYPKMAEGGINVVQMGYGNAVFGNEETREKTLNALKQNGIKGLFCLYIDMKAAGHPANLENTKKLVAKYKDDDRIFAWAVQDEPLGAGVTPEKMGWLEDSYRAIREADPYHPIYVLDFDNHKYTVRYGDVYVADIYAHGNDTRFVSAVIEPLNKMGRINTYELAATYKQNNAFPPTNTIRGSIYRAFEAGSNGVGYYSISDAIGHDFGDVKKPLYELDMWPDFVTLNKVEIPLLYDYFVNGKGTHFNSFREGPINEEIMWYQWFMGEDMYLLAHNRGRAEAKVTIPLESGNGRIKVGGFSAEPVGLTSQKAITGTGKIEMTLKSEEMALYKIKTNDKIDLKDLDKSRFTDLAGYDWAEAAIEALSALGIANQKGDGLYAPGQPITRGDFAMYLVRALGLSGKTENNFADVNAEAEYASALAIGKDKGILQGVGDNNFNPEGLITRQEVMTICARGMALAGKRAKGAETALDGFSDKGLVAGWAQEAVRDVIASGIIQGSEGALNPLGNTTRAEAAVIMKRIIDAPKVAEVTQPATEPPKQEEAPQVIEFKGEASKAQLEKWENAKLYLSDFGMKQGPEVTSSITWAQLEEAVSGILGYNYKTVNDPKSAVTFDKAVEAAVALTGYDVYAQYNGGIMAAAAAADILDGVGKEDDGYMRSGDVYVLLKNTLEAKQFVPSSYGAGGADKYQVSDDSLLSQYCGIELYEGRIDGNFYTSLIGSSCGIGEITLDGRKFGVGETNARDLLGYRVKAYVSKRDPGTIKHIEVKRNVTVKVIDSLDIEPGKSTTTRICVHDNNYKLIYEAVSPTAYVIVNGQLISGATVSDIIPENGRVILISDTGTDASVVITEDFDNYVVKSVDAESRTIYFKNGTNMVLDKDIDKYLRLENKDGAAFETESLKEWNVLSVAESANGRLRRVILSTEKLEGAPTETSADKVTIKNTEYSYAKGLRLSPELGSEATFYLNFKGEIAAMNTTVIPNYGYYVTIANEGGINDSVKIKIFNMSGEMKIFEVAESVKLNGEPMSKEKLAVSRFMMVDATTPRSQLVIYETNGKEEVSEITTAVDGTDMTDDERATAFTLDADTGDTALSRVTAYSTKIIAQKYVVSGDVVAFVVPSTYSDDVKDYGVKNYSYFVHGEKYYNALLYDVDKDREVKAVVQKTQLVSKADTSAPRGVVVGSRKVLDDDGMQAVAVDVMTKSGSIVTLKFTSVDFKITLGAKCITNSSTESETTTNAMGVRTVNASMTPDKLNFGDVVNYVTNATGYVTGMGVLFRAKSPAVREISEEGLGEDYDYSNMTRAYAAVTETGKNGIVMSPGAWERFYAFTADGKSYAGVIICDMDKKEAKFGAREDIKVGDKVFVSRTNPYVDLMTVYR